MVATPEQMEQTALQALSIAREHRDADLEAAGLAFGGQACVSLGRVDAGMTQLDEAMTMVTAGDVSSFMFISEIFCVLLSACALAGDRRLSERRSDQRAGHSTRSEARDEGADAPNGEHPEVHQVGRVATPLDDADAEAQSDEDEIVGFVGATEELSDSPH